MRILITGGHGFLGRHVAQEFRNHGYEIYDGYSGPFIYGHFDPKFSLVWRPHQMDCNLESKMSSLSSTNDCKPDVILHMAAVCGGLLANKNRPADFLRINTQMGLNIYEAARFAGTKRVYSLGTVCAYPKHCPVPFKEDDIWNGCPEETNAPYAQSKRTLLMLSQTYRQQYGIGGAHLIPVNLYGEHDHFDLTNSHVVPALIRKFDNAIVNNLPTVECWGTGEATREFLYAGDAAQAIVKAIETGLDTELPINLGVGRDISIKDLASLIGGLCGYTGQIVFTGEVSDGQPKRMLDVSRAKALLGWQAETNFRDGLTKTIEWYRQNKSSIV